MLQIAPNDDGFAFLVDIGLGGSGSEEVFIPNILIDESLNGSFNNMVTKTWSFPLHIPSGTRISARCQQTGTASVRGCEVAGQLMEGDMMFGPGYSKCEAWGSAIADTSGRSIDPGGMANTVGGWDPLKATTTIEAKAIVVSIGNQLNTARNPSCGWLTDIGVGAISSEEVLIKHIWHRNSFATISAFSDGPHGLFPVNIASGERVSARAQCSINDATDRLFDMVVHAVGN